MSELARVEAVQRGRRCYLRLFGEVDISNAQDVSASIQDAVPNDAVELVVDLTETRYLDSAGLTLLLRLFERLQARRQQVKLVVGADSPVRAVLELTGLPQLMEVEIAGAEPAS